MTMKRRDALKTIGALGATAGVSRILPGCGDSAEPVAPATTVCLLMENRSYDHWLGARTLLEGKPGDGLVAGMQNPRMDGTMVEPFPATFNSACVLDPPHDWNSWDIQFNAGANDGFVRAHEIAHSNPTAINPMQYQTRDAVPASWALADAYTVCDRWFCSVRGPTFPNRMYWHSGQSVGQKDNTTPTMVNWPTLYHRLQERNVDWAYYYGDIGVLSLLQGVDLTNRIRRFEDFLDDAAAGTLPPVVYIDPAFVINDDHPPKHTFLGQGLLAAVYTALATSPHWRNCMLIVTYDENGGFFDHVAPPTTADDFAAIGFNQLGFRVPTIIAGPYVKQGYASSVVYDHTSVLKHFEAKFGLAPLTMRSTAANDILDVIDMDRLAAGDWAEPAAIPPIEIDYAAIDAACSTVTNRDHPMLEWADRNKHLLGEYDRRDHAVETMENIVEYLDKHNAGRMVGTKNY